MTWQLPLLTAALAAAVFHASAEDGFTRLGNGTDMSPFDLVGTPEDTWTVTGDVIAASGTPNGYFATKEDYEDFELRLDLRFIRPADLEDEASFRGNSGVLLFIREHRVWPQCVEVQGMNRDLGRIFAIGGAPAVTAHDLPDVRARVRSPVGEWNTLIITARGGAVTAMLNGTVVCTSEPGELRRGPIGFQSEGAPVEFRNIRIKRL